MNLTPLLITISAIAQAACSTIIACACAVPLAYFFCFYRMRGKNLLCVILTVLCIMPTKIVAACVGVTYGIGGFWAIVLGHVVLNVPLACYQFYLALSTLDETHELVAYNLGATRWKYYFTVVFPLMRPTILKTAAFIFFLCFTAISVPLMLGTCVYHATPDVMIYHHMSGNYELFFYGAFRILVVVSLLLLQRKNSAEHLQPPVEKKTRSAKNGLLLWYSVFTVTFLCFPLILIARSAININILIYMKSICAGLTEPLLGHVRLLDVIQNSLLLAYASACGAILLYVLLSRIWQKMIMIFFVFFPLILGPSLISTFLSHTGISQEIVALLSHVLIIFPFVYTIMQARMAVCSPELYFLAQSLGADRYTYIRTVFLPLMRSALIQSWCVAFGLSMTYVVGSGEKFVTIPYAIHAYRAAEKTTEVVGMSVMLLGLVGVVCGCVWAANWVVGRKAFLSSTKFDIALNKINLSRHSS